MNIAIDIDDTLTDSFAYFQPFVAEYFRADINELKRANISYANLPEPWKKDEIGFCKAYYDRFAAETPFKPDAAWGVRKLREQGHKIIIITGRTAAFYTDPYKTTQEELAKGGIVYDKLICTLDKAAACLRENISVLLDDSLENCMAAVRNGIPAVLFDSKGNQSAKTELRRVSDWSAALQAVSFAERGYPDRKTAEQLLCAAQAVNPGLWVQHSRIAAACAQQIAKACAMDAEKAYVLGLLHDIGRKFLIRDLGHIYYGYRYMKRLGYGKAAQICLTHSFPNQDLNLYIGKSDIPENEIAVVRKLLREAVYDDYDRLIQLCDALAGSEGVMDIEQRMADVKRRYGNYPQVQWDKNIELKRYFESKCDKNIYDIVQITPCE